MIDQVVKAAHAYADRAKPIASVEFKHFLREMVASEQIQIDEAIEAGATFVRSSNGKIHTLDCASNGFHPVRQAVYDAASASPDSGPIYLSSGRNLSMPELMTREQVESLPGRYVRCRLCRPKVRESIPPRKTSPTPEVLEQQLARKYEKSHSRPLGALIAVLQLHRESEDAHCCADDEFWPCRTIDAITIAYGMESTA